MTAWQTIRETPRRIGEAASQARPQLRGIISPPRRLSSMSFAVLVVALVVWIRGMLHGWGPLHNELVFYTVTIGIAAAALCAVIVSLVWWTVRKPRAH